MPRRRPTPPSHGKYKVQRILAELRTQLVAAAGQVEEAEGEVPTDIGQIANAIGRNVALNLGSFWRASAQASPGPIDVIDMFSGCGGMSAGFRAVNGCIPLFNIVMAVDTDHTACKTYEHNLGISPLTADVAELSRSPEALKKAVQQSGRRKHNPLILIGCAPCQGFSSHRNSAGRNDGRNSLFVDFARIARSLNPDAIIIENVPELLTTEYWPFLQEAKGILAAAGYSTYVGVHNMAEFGVPQERFRAVVLALRKSFTPPHGFLGGANFRTVRQVLGKLPKVTAGERHPADDMHYSAGHKASTLATISAVPKDGGNRPPDAGPDCLRRGKQRQGKAIYEDVYGRLHWDRPAITITAYARNPASGRFIHPEQDRGLTVREAALLQAFPPDYWFSGSLDERFRQIGNAVPPAFAAYLACHLVGQLLTPTTEPSALIEQGIREPVGASFSRIIPSLKAASRAAAQV